MKRLWLQVTNGGASKSWVFRWTDPTTKRERVMGLGPVHTVDLDQARDLARGHRQQLRNGKVPLIERDGVRLDAEIAAGLAKTLAQVGDEWLDAKIAHKSSDYFDQTFGLLARVTRVIGDMPIQKVNTEKADVATIEPLLWQRACRYGHHRRRQVSAIDRASFWPDCARSPINSIAAIAEAIQLARRARRRCGTERDCEMQRIGTIEDAERIARVARKPIARHRARPIRQRVNGNAMTWESVG